MDIAVLTSSSTLIESIVKSATLQIMHHVDYADHLKKFPYFQLAIKVFITFHTFI